MSATKSPTFNVKTLQYIRPERLDTLLSFHIFVRTNSHILLKNKGIYKALKDYLKLTYCLKALISDLD